MAFQDHSNDALLNHSSRPVFSFGFLPQFPLGMGAYALGQRLSFHQHQQPQAATATGLPRAHQHTTTDNTTFGGYSSSGLTNLSALGNLPIYSTQTTTNTSSMVIDIAIMAKVIPNVTLKLQKRRLYRVSL